MSTSATIESLRAKMAEDMRKKSKPPTEGWIATIIDEFHTPPTKTDEPTKPYWPNLLPSTGVSYRELFPEFMPATAQDFRVPTFHGYEYPAWMMEYIPKSSDYLAPKELVYNAVLAFARKSVTHIVGHPGTGKSEGLPNLIASRLGLPMFRFALNKKGMAFDDLVGRESIVVMDGHSVTAHKDGLLVKVVQHPTFVLLDEFCRANQEITNGCMSLMERNGKLIVENRADPVIKRHPDCWVVASDNVKGLGDAADRMVGTELLDGAILDRFDVTIEVDYLPQADLKNLIEQWVPGIPDSVKLSKFSLLVQEAYKKGNLPLSLSPRGIRAIAEYACIHQDYAPAVRKVFLCKLAEESDIACVREAYRTAFGTTL